MKKYDADRLNSIKYLIKERKFSQALTEVIAYMDEYPDNAYAKYQHGLILKGLSHLDEAFDVFYDVYDSNASNKYSALYEMGRIKAKQKDYDYAKFYFEKIIKESPYAETFTLIELSKIEKRNGNLERSEFLLTKACMDRDDNTKKYAVLELAKLALLRNKKEQADDLIATLQSDGNKKFQRKIDNLRGRMALASSNYQEALQYLENSLGNIKDDVYWTSILDIAKVYEKQGKFQEAYELCQRLKNNNNDFKGDVDLLIGTIYQKQGEISKAKEAYLKLIASKDAQIEKEALLKLGALELEQKNIYSAKKYFQKITTNKNLYTASAYFSLIYIAIREENYQNCYELLEQIKKLEINSDMKENIDKITLYLDVATAKEITNKKPLSYTKNQIINYDETEALNYTITRNNRANIATFNSDIDISAIFFGVKEYLTEDKLDTKTFMDYYTFDYPEIGTYNGEVLNSIRVVCLPNTKNIITMYPYHKESTFKEEKDEIAFQEKDYPVKKKVIPRMSQIEKFNARYQKNK